MTTSFLKQKIGIGATRAPVSPWTLSVALIGCSVVWLVAVCACYAPIIHVDWSDMPLSWPLILMITPPTCFSIAVILLNTRPTAPLSALERCALVAAFFPVIPGTYWTIWGVKALFWESFQEAPIALKIFGTSVSLALVAISSTMIWKSTRILMTLPGRNNSFSGN